MYRVDCSCGVFIHTPVRQSALHFARRHCEKRGHSFTWTEPTPEPSPRFVIRKTRSEIEPYPWRLRDRQRPAFLGRYHSVEAALRMADAIVRYERMVAA